MTFLELERSLESYFEKISSKAKNTQIAARNSLRNFEKFCNDHYDKKIEEIVEELQAIKSTNENAVFDVIQAWINWNKGKIVPAVIRTHFSHLKSYLYYRKIKLTPQDVKENLSFPKNLQEEPYPLRIEDLMRIFKVARYDKKALYLAQLSSAMRIGEAVQIRKKHLDLSKKRIMIKIPASITKVKKARTTILSKEAAQFIIAKLKKLKEDDLVWGVSEDPHNAEINEMNILNSYCKKVGLDQKYESTGRLKINSHSFRAYFITKISRHDENFAKKLAGQKGYLLQYDRMSDEDKLQRYLQLEPELLIFDESKKNAEIEKLRNDKTKYSNLAKDFEEFKEEVKSYIKEMRKKEINNS